MKENFILFRKKLVSGELNSKRINYILMKHSSNPIHTKKNG